MHKMTNAENVGEFKTFDEAQIALDCRLRQFVRLSDERTFRLWSRIAKWTAADIYTAEYWIVFNRCKRAREFSDYCQNKRYELRGI